MIYSVSKLWTQVNIIRVCRDTSNHVQSSINGRKFIISEMTMLNISSAFKCYHYLCILCALHVCKYIFYSFFPLYFYCRWKRKLIKKQFTSIIRVYQQYNDARIRVVSFYNTSSTCSRKLFQIVFIVSFRKCDIKMTQYNIHTVFT